MESCDCDRTSIHDCVCPECRIRYLEYKLEVAREGLVVLNGLLWYDTVPDGEKEKIVKILTENGCRVDMGWDQGWDDE